MGGPHLKSLRVTQNEVKAALARERRPRVRKRLLAVSKALTGKSIKQAARAAKAEPGSVRRWLELARDGGLSALLRGPPRNKRRMKPKAITAARSDIAAALRRPLHWRLRSRLKAIDAAALAGEPLQNAAALVPVKPQTLATWLAAIRERQIAPLLAKWEAARQPRLPEFNADPAIFHSHAAREKHLSVRKRLRALAYLAEGLNVDAAALRARLSTDTVRRTLRSFQQDGVAAILAKPQGARPRLRPNELQAVAAMARDLPAEKLCIHIEAEFGVRYTPRGLKDMLKKHLGISSRRGCATQTHPGNPLPSTKT